MPNKAKRLCSYPGCYKICDGRYCEKHANTPETKYRDNRESASMRGYDGKWRKARLAYLAKHPLCVKCKEAGKLVAATVVDHIVPHKGDYKLFWDSENWQPLCKECHDIKTASEDGGFGNKERN